MTFTQNSYLVKFYIRKVNEGVPRENIPALFNLQEIVYSILDN